MTGALVLADPDGADHTTRLVRDVRTALDKLATAGTRTQIAAELDAAGIRGWTRSASACPIASYLVAAVPDLDPCDVMVARTYVGVCDDRVRATQAVGLPDAVAAFVRRFDEGDFPQLDSTPDRRTP